MSKIPERNLDPPKEDYIECPDCADSFLGAREDCFRCQGLGFISRAEERRELAAAIGDKEHDRREDDKWRREEEGK